MTSPEPDQPTSPLRHDHVTMICPACHDPFTPTGRQIYCSDACRDDVPTVVEVRW